MTGAGPTVRVHLRSLPVQTWGRSQEQTEGLLREVALIAAEQGHPAAQHQLPARLLALVDALNATYGGLTDVSCARPVRGPPAEVSTVRVG